MQPTPRVRAPEIEHDHLRAIDIFGKRQRRMQFDRGQVRHPHQGREIVGQNIVHIAIVALAQICYQLFECQLVLEALPYEVDLNLDELMRDISTVKATKGRLTNLG